MRTVTEEVVVMDGCSDESFQRVRPLKTYLAGGLRSGWQDKWIAEHPGEHYFDPRELNDGSKSMRRIAQIEMRWLRECDEVYAYFERDNPSGIGLAFECGYARALGKPVTLVDETDNPWLAAACSVTSRQGGTE